MRYVALLRGINVGGNMKVEMAKLRQVFVALGCTNVTTYINSGNVLFNDPRSATKLVPLIETALKKKFAMQLRVVLRTAAEIAAIVQAVPSSWVNGQGQKVDVLFLWDQVKSRRTVKALPQNPKIDTFVYAGGAIAWHILFKDWSRSGMSKFVGSDIYKNITARNINTVRKLDELLKLK